ncbi:hypothetical protein RJ639_041944 [Escallonia herrerae]|uniref:Uncharacterized protein n=1 Tax=Escallonia herrerae TaxID=1293975 RepID=A0AA88WF48_9ASTE|nr:hypothetical protein RJ639_041944 [Escallonia herrerae]
MFDEDVKAHNVFEREKEEFEAILHMEAKPHNHHHKETHGLRDDIDKNTPIKDVKAPNVFERAKEEIEALAQTIHSKKGTKSHGSPSNGKIRLRNNYLLDAAVELKPEKPDTRSVRNDFQLECFTPLLKDFASTLAEKDVKAPNLIERAKEGMEAMMHKEKSPHRHHKETHGKSEDINENTSTSEIKGPNVFERAKEEIEALIQTIHPKKQSDNVVSSPKKEDGFCVSLGKGLAKVCSPRGHKRD